MTKIAILGGRVIDPANQVDEIKSIAVVDGKISYSLNDFTPDVTIDATQKIISPGFVDLNAEILSEINSSAKFWSALKLAPTVGITHVASNAFFSTRSFEIAEIENYARKNLEIFPHATVALIGALTQNLAGTQLSELQLLKNAGCVAFTNGKQNITNTLVKKRCYDYAAMLNAKVLIHPEDNYLSARGVMHEGEVSLRLGIPAIPSLAESIALAQEILLIEETTVPAHIRHLSAAKSISLLAMAQQNDLKITADVAIHNLFLTDIDVQLENGLAHTNPPLRGREDLQALRAAIKNGVIAAIASDHIKLSKDAKELPFQDSKPGIASWPVLLPLILRLAEEEKIPLIRILACITSEPANILGLDAGHLSVGAAANLVVFDPNEEWTLQDTELDGFGYNNPFKNWLLKGRVKSVIINGELLKN